MEPAPAVPAPAPAPESAADPGAPSIPGLSAAERAFLAEHPRLVIAYAEAPPYATERGGVVTGHSVELLEAAARSLGVAVQWRRLSLNQALAAVESGAAEALINVVQSPERLALLRFGERTARLDTRLFTRADRPEITDLDSLGGSRVAIWAGYPFRDLLAQRSPGVRFVITEGYAEALTAVDEGRADLVLIEAALGRMVIAERQLANLVDRGPAELFPPPGTIASLFAVRRDQEVLAGLLDRAVDAVPPGRQQTLWQRWFGATDTPAALRARVRLTEAERAEIAAHPELVLGVDADWSPLIIRNADGSFSGIDADTADLINATLGTRIRFETGRWADQVTRALRGDIDGLSASAVHPERADRLRFTRPYTEATETVFVKAGNPLGIRRIEDLYGRRIAYTRGNLASEKRLRPLPGVTPVPVESALDAINRLLSEDVEVLLNNEFLHFWAVEHDLTAIEPAFVLPDALPLVFSIRPDRPLLVSAIDKVLGAIPPELRAAIKGRYMDRLATRERGTGTPVLSEAEREYLKTKGGVLRYCFSPVWMPYDYLENGEHRGIFREYLELFGRRLGVGFVPLPAPTWPEALHLAEERQCDLVSGLVRTAAREQSFAFTSPYLNLTLVLVARDEAPFVAGIEDLAGKPIAVPTHSAIATALRARLPGQPLVELGNIDEFEDAITSGRVYAAVATLEHAAELIERGLGRLRIIGKLDDPYPIAVAVRNDQPPLFTIMQKAVDTLTPAERDRISRRRTTFHLEQTMDLTRLWQALGAIGLLGLFLGWRQWELTRLNHRLVRARDAADLANRAKGDFLANMSHEIRTPLNAVLNLAALGQRVQDPGRLRGYLEEIGRAGASLLNVVNEILDFSRLEAGAEAVHAAPFGFADLIERVHSIAAPLAADKGLALETDLDPGLAGTWIGDAHKLERVLVNLVGNAIKFTDRGGVRLLIAPEVRGPDPDPHPCPHPDRDRTPDAEANGDGRVRVQFAVCDTGIGIGDGQLARLFAPFEQGDNSASRRYGGTGLGLTIVRRLIDLMGGDLRVESRPGEGACFRVVLALGRAAQPAAGAAAVPVGMMPQPTGGHPRRVLVVEDNPVNRTIALAYLELLGLAAEAVADGRAALARLALDPEGFDLVLMDIQMPGLDGYETTRRLRADPRFGALPVIAVTAHVLAQDRARCRAAGMDDHIPKPFDQAVFAATLARWLPLPGAPAPGAFPPAPAAPTDGGAATADGGWLDTIEGVRRIGGEPSLYLRLLIDFVSDYDPRVATLRSLAAAGAWEGVGVLAHRLRGTAPMLGAGPLAALGAALDDRIREGHTPSAAAVADFIDALVGTLEAARVLTADGEPAAPAAALLPDRSADGADDAPPAGAAPSGPEARDAPEAAAGPRARVLIVDDDPVAAGLLSEALAGECRLSVAADGQAALALARARPAPDLILLDVMMDGLDGYQVCRTLKADPATRGLPVIFISARGLVADERRGLELGAIDYIHKPFEPEVVRARVRNHLALKRRGDTLTRLSHLDPLTGLPNRRRFDAYLGEQWQRAADGGTPLALLMIDVDHFKAYNDCYGHAAGDLCLRRVAEALEAVVRPGEGLVARYGGEEFAWVLPRTDLGAARAAAGRALAAVRALAIPHAARPGGATVTLSLGVASARPGAAEAAEAGLAGVGSGVGSRAALLAAADRQLYRAKSEGRDRVVG